MKTREDYDKIIDDIKTKLGDDFSKISDVVADLSTDYDSVIAQDKQYQDDMQKLKDEKVQLLETNNKLFTQVTNKAVENKDPIEKKKQDEENDNKLLTLDDVVDEKGGLN